MPVDDFPYLRGFSGGQVGPMIRVYDTPALWRHDEILRIRHLEAEIADMQKDIEIQKQEAVAAVERLERTKKWLGIID